jgi:hypothetical protein
MCAVHRERPIARAYGEDEVPVFEHAVVIEGDMVMTPIESNDLSSREQLDLFVRIETVRAHCDPGVVCGPQEVCFR